MPVSFLPLLSECWTGFTSECASSICRSPCAVFEAPQQKNASGSNDAPKVRSGFSGTARRSAAWNALNPSAHTPAGPASRIRRSERPGRAQLRQMVSTGSTMCAAMQARPRCVARSPPELATLLRQIERLRHSCLVCNGGRRTPTIRGSSTEGLAAGLVDFGESMTYCFGTLPRDGYPRGATDRRQAARSDRARRQLRPARRRPERHLPVGCQIAVERPRLIHIYSAGNSRRMLFRWICAASMHTACRTWRRACHCHRHHHRHRHRPGTDAAVQKPFRAHRPESLR
ncbi:hypothetical protein BH11PSE8_BH11PSE8_19170 [soil metagenome]